MATGIQNQKIVPENLRKQLAIAVRSIQWSYAIFWSNSVAQPGVLEWGDGFYNGDIKTRKTVQSVELNQDQLGLQRSDQLRELYESLSLGETNTQAKRPTAALSPEDLTDAEWFFLVCMSFIFNIGQGLPGRTLARNQAVWLCNAHRADTKVFSRSLLAKSASIQTVVCFPYSEGVVELGATELVPEDLNLIQHIKTSFLDSPATVPKIPNYVSNSITNNNDLICEALEHANIPENDLDQLLNCPDTNICSPDNSLDDFADNLLIDESNLAEGINGEVPQTQSWPFMDDAISNCLNSSMNSSDCISQTHENLESFAPLSDGKGPPETNNCMHSTQKCNQQIENTGVQGDEVHYQGVLSNLLKSSHQLVLGPYFRNGNRESSFVSWNKDGSSGTHVPRSGTSQRFLKKVLFEVARMHENSRLDAGKQKGNSDCLAKPTADEIDRNHVLSERKRREKINERFMILASLVPSGGKVDKVSILDHTIDYLRGLERKVDELESNKMVKGRGRESTTKTKLHDAIERTSDNYGATRTSNVKKPLTNKRKASDTDKIGAVNSRGRLKDSLTDNITVNITNKDVLIVVTCSSKEFVLLEVMEAVRRLSLDSETVQSSNRDGMISITIKAKCKGLKVASASVIKQALQKVTMKS
uniref:DEL n=2 Tax=Antirrhinum majus TaxID=4151 RepID=Q38736_ANTMA|nr:DEL [Antirrhinum majus]